MAVIVFQNSKGGVGKTTGSILVGACLANGGATVSLVDATHNTQITDWSTAGKAPASLRIVTNVGGKEINEDNVGEIIQREAQRSEYVVVDLDGIADARASHAVFEADLAIIPLKGSNLDAGEAKKSLKLINRCSQSLKRQIPYALLITQTSASPIRGRETNHVVKSIRESGLPVFKTELNEREAFRSIWSWKTTLDGLAPGDAPNLENAKLNVRLLVKEILEMLVGIHKGNDPDPVPLIEELSPVDRNVGVEMKGVA